MNKFSLLLIIYFFCISCSQDTNNKSVINEKSLDLQVLEAYQDGMNELENGDALFAAKSLMKQKFYFHNLNGHQRQL